MEEERYAKNYIQNESLHYLSNLSADLSIGGNSIGPTDTSMFESSRTHPENLTGPVRRIC